MVFVQDTSTNSRANRHNTDEETTARRNRSGAEVDRCFHKNCLYHFYEIWSDLYTVAK